MWTGWQLIYFRILMVTWIMNNCNFILCEISFLKPFPKFFWGQIFKKAFHLWYTGIKGFSGMFSPRSHVSPLPLPHSLPSPQPWPALLNKDQGLPPRDSWHLPACCPTFASVCYKWVCWTKKHLAETTSKFSQGPFTAPFFWETEPFWSEAGCYWGWRAPSRLCGRAGRQAGLSEALPGRHPPRRCGCSELCYPGLPHGVRCALTTHLFCLYLSFSWTYKEPTLMMTVMTMTVMALMMLSSFWGSIL